MINPNNNTVIGIKDKSTPIGFAEEQDQENVMTSEVSDEQVSDGTNPDAPASED